MRLTVTSWYLDNFNEVEEIPTSLEDLELEERGLSLLEGGSFSKPIRPVQVSRKILNLLWIDGVRRSLARLIVEHDGSYYRGVLAAIAAGGVKKTIELDGTSMRDLGMEFIAVEDPSFKRFILALEPLGEKGDLDKSSVLRELENLLGPALKEVKKDIKIGFSKSPENNKTLKKSSKLTDLINEAMRELEVECTQKLAPESDILFTDGTLRKFREKASKTDKPLVGIVKRHLVKYYPEELENQLLNAPRFHRSSLMRASLSGYEIYTFYLKMNDVVGFDGLLRIEMLEETLNTLGEMLELSSYSDIADWISQLVIMAYDVDNIDLSLIVSRWPRNPLFIEGLERRLKNLLPSPELFRRLVTAFAK